MNTQIYSATKSLIMIASSILIFTTIGTTPAHSAQPALENRVSEMEREIATLREEINLLRNELSRSVNNPGEDIKISTRRKINIQAERSVTIEAKDEITLKAGPSYIRLRKDGQIDIEGKTISVRDGSGTSIKGNKIQGN